MSPFHIIPRVECFAHSITALVSWGLGIDSLKVVLTHASIRPIHQWAQPTRQSDGHNNILIFIISYSELLRNTGLWSTTYKWKNIRYIYI